MPTDAGSAAPAGPGGLTVRALSARGGPVRYAAAGLVNSGVGYAVILALGAAGLHPYAANAGGFAVGFLVSLLLASVWTFGPAKRPAAPARYALAFAACYAGNLVVVAGLLAAGAPGPLAQAAGVAAYAGAFYAACRWWVYGDASVARADARASLALALARPGAAAVAVAALVGVPVALLVPVPSDVLWQMWIARQLLGGADLYTGILEVNPPLWFWMAMPVQAIAEATGLPPTRAVNLAVTGLAVLAVALCGALTRGEAPRGRLALLLGIAGALIVLPIIHYAQREHIALIGAVPYLLLAAKRTEAGARVPAPLAFGVGALFALGIALKHYYVLLPVFVEAWRVWRGGGLRGTVRAETVALGAAGLAYAGAMAAFSRDFFEVMLPIVSAAYDGYGTDLGSILREPRGAASVFLAACVATCAGRLPAPARGRAEALLLGWLAFYLAFVIQSKGFDYHLIPVAGLGLLAGGIAVAGLPTGRAKTITGAAAASLLVCVGLGDRAGPVGETYPFGEAGVGEGDTVLALSAVASWSLPGVEARGAVWTSRSLGLWPLVAVAKAQEEGVPLSARHEGIVRDVAAQMAEDATCAPPDFILTEPLLSRHYPAFEGDILGALARYEDARAVLSAYEVAAERAPFVVYRRVRPLPPPPPGARCRMIR